ncbi:MAG: 1-acyl-sn-glycerol-3-phosphate acyltransferase [Immundisolibacteraceae bacterium]|nr:1-acyl-sn-glycerol-3-phosphate acyltransferase [Immundisolibacteraceae bacterium]
MKAIRSLLFSIGMLISIPIAALVILLFVLGPPIYRFKVSSAWCWLVLSWLRITCNISFRIEGQEYLAQTPAVFLSKHQSTWETLALQVVYQPLTWVAKRELMRVPLFGWGLSLLKPIAIDRAAGRKAMEQIIEQGTDRLRSGISVVVFPEGTRTSPGTKRRYRLGGAVLAKESGFKVIPVAHNAGQFWGRRSFVKQPGEIVMRFGVPIDVADKSPSQIIVEVEEWIEATVAEISGVTEVELI